MYSVTPTTLNHESYLQLLQKNSQFDFWSDGWQLNQNVDVMVSAEAQSLFERQLQDYGVEYSVIIDNVERFTFKYLDIVTLDV